MKIKRVNHHFSPSNITELSKCEVFVFGSNLQGTHGGGAARIAYNEFGAEWGVGEGPTGRCYAIPTMHGGLDVIRPYVEDFLNYAKKHPMQRFLLTRVGCGIAGFKDSEMAPLFAEAIDIPNIAIPREWLPYMLIDITLGCKIPMKREESPKVITEEALNRLCKKYLYEIGAGIGEHLPTMRIRYVSNTNEFCYTGLENCFFLEDGRMYVWETDEKWNEFHNQDIVEMVFEDECKGRGFARQVIYAGVDTGVKDSNGNSIFTGDVIRLNDGKVISELALGAFMKGYCFILDNHSLFLTDCDRNSMTRIGTVFFQLNTHEYPISTINERTMNFNGWYDSNEEHQQKVLMSKFTPNYEKEIWKYLAMEEIGLEYQWYK